MQCAVIGSGEEFPNPLIWASGKLNSNPGSDSDLLVNWNKLISLWLR